MLWIAHDNVCFCLHRLNWQLHFGEHPRWSRDVKFILVDPQPSERDAQKAQIVLRGDAAAVAQQLQPRLGSLRTPEIEQWRSQLATKVRLYLLLC